MHCSTAQTLNQQHEDVSAIYLTGNQKNCECRIGCDWRTRHDVTQDRRCTETPTLKGKERAANGYRLCNWRGLAVLVLLLQLRVCYSVSAVIQNRSEISVWLAEDYLHSYIVISSCVSRTRSGWVDPLLSVNGNILHLCSFRDIYIFFLCDAHTQGSGHYTRAGAPQGLGAASSASR